MMGVTDARGCCDEVLRKRKRGYLQVQSFISFSLSFFIGLVLFTPTFRFLFVGVFLMLLSSITGFAHAYQTRKLAKHLYSRDPMGCAELRKWADIELVKGGTDSIMIIVASLVILCLLFWELLR